MPNMQQLTTIFLGPQGSGKGTQSALFEADLKRLDPGRPILHFEMGKHMRALAAGQSYTSGLIQKIVSGGGLVPFNISSSLFTAFFVDRMRGNEHIIIDGFPRSESQMEVVETTMEFYKRENPAIVYIELSDEEGVTRLLKRARSDDTDEKIRTRLAWTRTEWAKIRTRIAANSAYTLVEINGDQTMEQVHADIIAKLGLA
jgi:adenylate kinase